MKLVLYVEYYKLIHTVGVVSMRVRDTMVLPMKVMSSPMCPIEYKRFSVLETDSL